MLEEFDAKFPGFEHEIHGITHVKDTETGRERYSLDVLA
jgi:arginine/lysine/ornithine decarboxylase